MTAFIASVISALICNAIWMYLLCSSKGSRWLRTKLRWYNTEELSAKIALEEAANTAYKKSRIVYTTYTAHWLVTLEYAWRSYEISVFADDYEEAVSVAKLNWIYRNQECNKEAITIAGVIRKDAMVVRGIKDEHNGNSNRGDNQESR